VVEGGATTRLAIPGRYPVQPDDDTPAQSRLPRRGSGPRSVSTGGAIGQLARIGGNRLQVLERIEPVLQATPFQGLYVKARATAWALQNDCGLLDPTQESTINDRLAASIVRDLLNLGRLETSIVSSASSGLVDSLDWVAMVTCPAHFGDRSFQEMKVRKCR
jgi:hypothetical protein